MIKSLQRYCIALLLLLFAAVAARAQSNTADSSIAGLYSLLARVGVHPAVLAERASLDAARHQIAINSSLPNPMLMLGAENLPTNNFSFTSEPMTAKMVGLAQSVPFPGKLAAQAAIAAQDTVTAGTALTEKENELARDVKQAYFEIYHLERAIAVYQYHVTTITELLKAEQHDLTTASATQSSVLDLELERSDMQTEVIEDQTKLAQENAALERATGTRLGNFPVPAALALPALPYTLAELDSMATQHRPMLAGFRSQAEQEALMAQREDLDKYPDFQFSLDYMQRDPLSASSPMNPTNSAAAAALGIPPMPMNQSDMVSAGVSIELPIYYGDQRREAISADEAMRTARLEEERSAELDIHAALETALAKLDGIRKQYGILRDDIYPAVTLSLQTSNANYTYGKATIDQVLRDELALMHRQHDRYRLEAEYNETLAELEYLTGMDLVRYSTNNDWK